MVKTRDLNNLSPVKNIEDVQDSDINQDLVYVDGKVFNMRSSKLLRDSKIPKTSSLFDMPVFSFVDLENTKKIKTYIGQALKAKRPMHVGVLAKRCKQSGKNCFKKVDGEYMYICDILIIDAVFLPIFGRKLTQYSLKRSKGSPRGTIRFIKNNKGNFLRPEKSIDKEAKTVTTSGAGFIHGIDHLKRIRTSVKPWQLDVNGQYRDFRRILFQPKELTSENVSTFYEYSSTDSLDSIGEDADRRSIALIAFTQFASYQKVLSGNLFEEEVCSVEEPNGDLEEDGLPKSSFYLRLDNDVQVVSMFRGFPLTDDQINHISLGKPSIPVFFRLFKQSLSTKQVTNIQKVLTIGKELSRPLNINGMEFTAPEYLNKMWSYIKKNILTEKEAEELKQKLAKQKVRNKSANQSKS